LSSRRRRAAASGNNNETKDHHNDQYNSYWTWQTWIPIATKAVGGILTALVHQTAGTVQKGFALVLGLVLSGLLQAWRDQRPVQPHQTAGTLLVLVSAWLHFTNPPAAAAAF